MPESVNKNESQSISSLQSVTANVALTVSVLLEIGELLRRELGLVLSHVDMLFVVTDDFRIGR